MKAAIALLTARQTAGQSESPAGRTRLEFERPQDVPDVAAWTSIPGMLGLDVSVMDRLEALARDWPRGESKLVTPRRTRQRILTRTSPFSPRTIGLYPTQLYETVSMVLLILLLLAYYPFRRHDGQLMVVLMVGYAVHRFINESLRIEPSYALGLTLSQWGSVVVLVAAVGIEVYLWRIMPSRWKGQTPPISAQPSGAKV